MSSISSIAHSGMNAAQMSLNSSANNIANSNTAGFQRQQVVLTAQAEGGVSSALSSAGTGTDPMVVDVVGLLQAKNAFLANLAVFKTSDKMTGALLDQTA